MNLLICNSLKPIIALKSVLHSINSHVLTGANPFFKKEIYTLLKHGSVTLTMSYHGHQINPLSIVLEMFYKTAGVHDKKRSF